MTDPSERRPEPQPPLPLLPFGDVWLGPAVMADDPCEAAFGSADPTGPREYYRARYYDPRAGRFVSEDPIGMDGGLNLFAYADGNPAQFSDPDGTRPGDKFPTAREAAIDALTLYFCESLAKDLEYCFRLYQNPDQTYSYEGPAPGTQHTCTPPSLPAGKTAAGFAHTHGADSADYDDESVSTDDYFLAVDTGGNGFLATPSGRMLEFSPPLWLSGGVRPSWEIGRLDPCSCE